MNIFHYLSLRETKYIHLSPQKCQGCWECVKACPEEVLVKMERTRHAHVHVKDPDACTGCKKCVRVCAYAAIKYTYAQVFPFAPAAYTGRRILTGDETMLHHCPDKKKGGLQVRRYKSTNAR